MRPVYFIDKESLREKEGHAGSESFTGVRRAADGRVAVADPAPAVSLGDPRRQQRAEQGADVVRDCPGRKPPFSAAKRPARPYKNAIQNRIT
jgi:hypothetical protein